MIAKIVKGVWFLSLLVTLAIFMYVYASLPEDIVVREGETAQSISRNGLFYLTLTLLTVLNAFIFIISRLYSDKSEYFRVWFYGLIIILNLFTIVALQFINLYNSQEKFNYNHVGYLVYGSIGLVVIWSVLWPVFLLAQKFLNKQVI